MAHLHISQLFGILPLHLLFITDAINTTKDSFSYHVYTVDTCGDVSNYSPTHTTIHLHDTLKGCEQAIYLNWNPYAGWPVKKYEIYRATNGGIETLLATVAGLKNAYKDSVVNYHNQYCYSVLAYDSARLIPPGLNKPVGKPIFWIQPK